MASVSVCKALDTFIKNDRKTNENWIKCVNVMKDNRFYEYQDFQHECYLGYKKLVDFELATTLSDEDLVVNRNGHYKVKQKFRKQSFFDLSIIFTGFVFLDRVIPKIPLRNFLS